MRFKRVMRWDSDLKWLRLFRVTWSNGVVGDGHGYSQKVSFAITPRLFYFSRGFHEWTLTILGLRIHSTRSYGGIFPD